MSIAEPMRLLWISGLTDCRGTKAWSNDILFKPSLVTVTDVTAEDFCLYVGNASHSSHYFGHEADRFASAAFETLLIGAKSTVYPRATAWLLIRAYYSAFFAVHSLMRLHGWACTRLSAENLKSVNHEISMLFPGGRAFDQGLYLLKSESRGRELRCRPLHASLGGTHEALWALLKTYFDEVARVVLSVADPGGQVLAVLLTEFLTRLDRMGGPKWLSTIRNRLNYAHEYGAWFPYPGSTSDYDRLHSLISGWTGSPKDVLASDTGDELVKFACCCSFLVSLCAVTMTDLTYRSKPTSPFRQSSGLLLKAKR